LSLPGYGDYGRGDATGECMQALGGLVVLAIVASVMLFGFLFFTSQGILFSETEIKNDLYSYKGFSCKYFTGTRVIDTFGSDTGCRRFIQVGD
jgi:hypothetical protein